MEREQHQMDGGQVRLDELDKDEVRLLARLLRPDWTDTQFEAAWADFCEKKSSGFFEPKH